MKSTNLSQRAQNLILNPVGLNPKSPQGFTLELDNYDKILTLNYGKIEKVQEEVPLILFYEVLTILGRQRTFASLSMISFREVENFLRDENTTPAFQVSIDKQTSIESLFNEARMDLLANFAIKLLKKNPIEPEIFSPIWEKKTLVEKNQTSLLLTKKINNFLPPEKKWEILLAEAEKISIKATSAQWNSSEYEGFLGPIWREFAGAEDIKVVAV